MRRKIHAFAAAFVTLCVVCVGSSAEDPRGKLAREQERSTLSIALEFSKKNRGPLVRALSALGAMTPNAYASGFLVDDGLVMTSYHVVSGQLSASKKRKLGFKPDDELEVRAYVNGSEAKTVMVDEVADLALLKVRAPTKQAKRATFSGGPPNGEQLLLIAQPGEYKMIRKGSFRGPYSFGGYEYWSIRIDGQDGFSGSPVYDSKGNIVGVFCRYDWKQGIALISPATHAQKLLTDYNSTQPTP